jgi:hypothetical protein
MARSDIAFGPLVTRSRRAVRMISSVVAARSRSRRDGTGAGPWTPGSDPVAPASSVTSTVCVTVSSWTQSYLQPPVADETLLVLCPAMA